MKANPTSDTAASAADPIMEAVQTVRHFVTETTGIPPTAEEIAGALKRYFVLNEIKDHIVMDRQN